jgi:hypothetical protein
VDLVCLLDFFETDLEFPLTVLHLLPPRLQISAEAMANEDIDMTDAPNEDGLDVIGDVAETPTKHHIDLPDGCPEIPDWVSTKDLVAIVTLHHRDAFCANYDSRYYMVPIIDETAAPDEPDELGCTIYLERKVGQPTYSFGRFMETPRTTRADAVDVFLPMTAAAKNQFTLAPAHETDFEAHRTEEAISAWRVESGSETVTSVNGVPIQKHTFRTKKKKVSNPHGLYLDDSRVNRIDVLGMKMEIWIVRKAGFVLDVEPGFDTGPLTQALQFVNSERHGSWARDRYILSRLAEPISNRSYRVLQRFTGRTETAKLFPEPYGLQERNREFLMFYKLEASISTVSSSLHVGLTSV